MKFLRRIKLEHIATILVGLLTAIGTVAYISLPWIVEAYVNARSVSLKPESYNTILSSMYCAGVPVLAMLVLVLMLSINICKEQAFIMTNVRYLNLISICSLVAGIVFFVSMFFLNSIFPCIIFVIFVLFSAFVKVFANLFKTAIVYKEENELTI